MVAFPKRRASRIENTFLKKTLLFRLSESCKLWKTKCTRAHIYKHKCMNTHIHIHTHIHTYTHKQTHTHTRMHTKTHSCTRACARVHPHTHSHIHTYWHTHAHKDTHRHSYTIIFIYIMKCLTFYSLKIWKTYTNCDCEFKKTKNILKNYHILNVAFKTQSSNF